LSNKSSAGSFCSLVVATATGTVNSVTSLNVTARGDGAECYCLANQSIYRYSATSTQTTIGDTFLVPLSGGGCWFKQNAESDFSVGVTGTVAHFQNSALIVPAVVGTWTALPTGTNFYEESPTSLMWSVNTTTGVITYGGPSGLKFNMSANLSFSRDTFSTPIAYDVDFTTNGALIGTTNDLSDATANFLTGTAGVYANFSHVAELQLNNGDTVQHMIRRITVAVGSLTETFRRYSVVISQI
jgi:hypothetical protein